MLKCTRQSIQVTFSSQSFTSSDIFDMWAGILSVAKGDGVCRGRVLCWSVLSIVTVYGNEDRFSEELWWQPNPSWRSSLFQPTLSPNSNGDDISNSLLLMIKLSQINKTRFQRERQKININKAFKNCIAYIFNACYFVLKNMYDYEIVCMYVCMYLKFISRHMSHSDSFARRVQQAMNESDERNMSLTVF